MSRATILRRMLNNGETIVLPGASDALSARLIELTGHQGLFITGYGVSARLFGLPDLGITTLTEMSNCVANITKAVRIPVVADAENGYGNILNTLRTVQEFVRAGAAGMYLNDKVDEICPHIGMTVPVISEDEMVKKIRVVQENKEDTDFVLFCSSAGSKVRPDESGTSLTDECIRRAKVYAKAGADVVFVPWKSIEDLRIFSEAMQGFGKPLMAVCGIIKPTVNVEFLRKLGYQVIVYAVDPLFASVKAELEVLKEMKQEGSTEKVYSRMVSHDEFLKIVELDKMSSLLEG